MKKNQEQPENPYLKACALLGETPRPELADRTNSDRVSEDAYHRLTICIRAKNMLNGKVRPITYDGSQYHYYPRFRPDPSGSGFACVIYDCWTSDTNVGERLEYLSYDLMMEGVNEFKAYYDDFHTPYVTAA